MSARTAMPPRLPPFSFVALRRSVPRRYPIGRIPSRPQSQFPQFPGGGRRRPNYNRFDRAKQIRYLWSNSQNFRYGVFAVGAGGGVFVTYNLERVPVSGRLRFNCVPESWEQSASDGTYQQVMSQYRGRILPPNHPDARMVQRVMDRLVPATGLGHEGWEVRVIADKEQKNAFVLPGGKVFVFSGILPICAGEDGLAAVLGHEIAHNVAHHTGEKISQQVWLLPLLLGITVFLDTSAQLASLILDFAIKRPGSRKMETEADLLGLLMMAKSCYDPEGVVTFWQRMKKAEQYAPPQFASTHPSSETRIMRIQEWLPRAQEARAESECGRTIEYSGAFSRAFRDEQPVRRRQPMPGQQSPRRDNDDDFW